MGWVLRNETSRGFQNCAVYLCGALQLSAIGCSQAADTPAENLGESSQAVFTGSNGLYEETIEQYSAFSNNGTDWGPAFKQFLTTSSASRLLLSCDKVYPVGATSDGLGACTSDGTEIRAAVNICREVTIVGCGNSTVIQSQAGVSAFAIRYNFWCGNSTSGTGAGTTLRDLVIRESGSASTRRFGVLMQSSAELLDVQIQGFSNGVRVDGNVNNQTCLGHTGASHWTMHRLQVKNAEHAGVLTRNGDSNVGDGRNIRASGNCVAPTKLGGDGQALYSGVQWPTCAGVIEDSQIGSTWTGIYSHDNSTFPGSRMGIGSGAVPVCVGCFSSGPVAESTATSGSNSLILGGRSTFDYTGVNISRGLVSNLSLFAPTMLPLDEPGDSDPVLLLQLQNGSRLQIEQDPLNPLALRGSLDGQDSKVAWRWIGSPPQWISYP